jgi:hypothetical protein
MRHGRRRESNEGDDPNCGMIYVHMETSKKKNLYNYHIPIKMFQEKHNPFLKEYSV